MNTFKNEQYLQNMSGFYLFDTQTEQQHLQSQTLLYSPLVEESLKEHFCWSEQHFTGLEDS